MTSYPAGPYVVEIPQVYSNLTHSLTFNCDVIGEAAPGSAPTAITLRSHDGTGVNLDIGVNAAWALIRPFFQVLTLASSYTLWKQTVGVTDRQFISAGALSAPNGVNPGGNLPAQQLVLTWRSAAGGIMKLQMLEGVFEGNARLPLLSSPDANVLNLSTYILGNDNWITARDRSFPVAAMNASYSQNEKVFNRRYRS